MWVGRCRGAEATTANGSSPDSARLPAMARVNSRCFNSAPSIGRIRAMLQRGEAVEPSTRGTAGRREGVTGESGSAQSRDGRGPLYVGRGVGLWGVELYSRRAE
ncbi:hypothetical protein COCVIDRAFT_33667 [Bipolaris victoriae FI3]|uniref:Uncharacterized protein n=1 Tax=Bipolaris victoriae (strain FI3) TaxID=930091 RepID=W7EXK9_BIPV3|nr:hypothetical protein COCVIDRAFT_33667 [Bipolaris victoriae FI3]